ncbi:RNA-directed RNA polymerase [ssRNA phage Esthiorhiza.2_30]|uniref:RNA-directed RNA polymerase n=2 Tax=Fiersviridae TaxID=2842319 RepID=A0A8S5L252_9VIRU|nr:RNA-directed RNA polymerase [ssRNA phage Esthiorhiza.2_30]QDH88008.1 MAG: RNA-dependent RNA polymerase [Leviviridae sp.]DAD51721.1 TPA_asm: RNA-directed RNA polymerase [ssRNA phage Esthiorhiza.2_30]
MVKHRRHAPKCANTKMPEGLTEELRMRILALPDNVKTSYLKEECFSKFVSSDTDAPENRRQAAIRKWLSVERDNEATNERLLLTPAEYNILPRVPFDRFVTFCQSMIVSIIGETAPLESLIGSFSGGASTSRPRTESYPASKYLGKAHATARCLDLFSTLVDELPGWLAAEPISPEIVSGNVLFTVPKKTDIDRVACKEPDLNMFIQKGIGSHFRECLRRIGINLNDQSINRSLARTGSISRELATFDLSSASDSVTTGLVQLLLPECWFTLLDSVRSHVTVIDGEEHRNEMFSSMGNGFTFELESLLFYTLTRAIAYFRGSRGIVSVYGDDIICPVGISTYLPFVFSYFGFSVNPDKSFVEGPLRESCGGHYYDGYDITPFYVKKPIVTLLDVIDVANKVRQWATEGLSSILNPEVDDLWTWLASHIPSRLWGGDDTNSKYQLVAYAPSSHRLVEQTIRKDNGTGGYYHWLNATWERTDLRDGVNTSFRSVSKSVYRLRKVRHSAVPALPTLFLSELRQQPSMVTSDCDQSA